MATALRLFAARGIDAVSLNEIVQAAEVNAAAIHYHFGSKDALIEAILRQNASALGERRNQLLDELEQCKRLSLRDVVKAMVDPITELKGAPGGLDYVQFLAGVSLHRRYSELLADITSKYTDRYLAVLARVTPKLSETSRLRRFAYARTFVYQAAATTDRTVELWLQVQGQPESDGDRSTPEDDLIDLLTAGINGP
jgi:AcrR family transcriptional regulator